MDKYKELSEFNLFKFLAENHLVRSGEICDPKGSFAFKLDLCVKNLSHLRVLTQNTEIWGDYCQKLLSLYGTCPTICTTKEEKSYFCVLTKSGKQFSFGNGHHRAELTSVSVPETENLCPKVLPKHAFFAYCALFCKENSAAFAVPETLVLNGNPLHTHSIF